MRNAATHRAAIAQDRRAHLPHVLSVSFQITEMRREWGGCAGNIAYNLKGLAGEPVVMATVGDDGGEYVERLSAFGIATEAVRTIAGTYTAQAYIITDLDDNQITAFHPGAMNQSHDTRAAEPAIVVVPPAQARRRVARCPAVALYWRADAGRSTPRGPAGRSGRGGAGQGSRKRAPEELARNACALSALAQSDDYLSVSIQLTKALMSPSGTCALGGIGTEPQTPEPPVLTFCVNFDEAPESPLYFAATS